MRICIDSSVFKNDLLQKTTRNDPLSRSEQQSQHSKNRSRFGEIMQPVQNIRPISELRTHQDEILKEADEAPVVLAQRSRPRAVLISVKQWDAISERITALEQAAEMLHGSLKEERKGRKHYTLDEITQMTERKTR